MCVCTHQEHPVGWAALDCSFSFMAEHLQFHLCLTWFKPNKERQKNVIEPPKTLTEVTSSVSDQTKRFNLRKIKNCFNLRIILSVLLPGALFFPICNNFSLSLCWIWQQLYPFKSPWISMKTPIFLQWIKLECFAETALWWLHWRIAVNTDLRFTTRSIRFLTNLILAFPDV